MIRLPWTSATSPHFVLEVNAECNISCRGCYKTKRKGSRSVSDLSEDVARARRLSRIHTVTLAGGEPTLHPDLPAIVRSLHDQGLKTSISSNGFALSSGTLTELSDAGLDVIMLHIDEGQTRPDLGASPSVDEINGLRAQIAEKIASFGIDVGLSVTIYPEYFDRIRSLVEFVLRSKEVNLLYVTHHMEMSEQGVRCPTMDGRRTTNVQVAGELRDHFGLDPFAALPRAGEDRHCRSLNYLSYYVPVIHGTGGVQILKMKGSWMDSLLIRSVGLFSGKFPFYVQPRATMIAGHVVLNGLGSGRLGRLLRFLWASRGRTMGAKRLVFDNGPIRTEDGRIVCTEPCPNRTLADGKLVPICMTDMEVRCE